MLSLIPLPIRIGAVALIIAGAMWFGYVKGTAAGDKELLAYKAQSEAQISQLKTENEQISGKVTVEYVDRVNTIHDKETVYRDNVVRMQPQHDLSNGWVEIHDAAAKLATPDSILASDKAPSGVMDNAALAVVVSNYSQCHQDRQQLISLQRWVNETKAAVDATNDKNPEEDK